MFILLLTAILVWDIFLDLLSVPEIQAAYKYSIVTVARPLTSLDELHEMCSQASDDLLWTLYHVFEAVKVIFRNGFVMMTGRGKISFSSVIFIVFIYIYIILRFLLFSAWCNNASPGFRPSFKSWLQIFCCVNVTSFNPQAVDCASLFKTAGPCVLYSYESYCIGPLRCVFWCFLIIHPLLHKLTSCVQFRL